MVRFFLISILCLLFPGILFSQATNFITDDCDGIQHSLFDSLDAGNVIVITWVMPCGPCATYSLEAYAAVQSFAVSHPGRVHFYMADDYANTSCLNLNNWANNNSMPTSSITTFSSSDVNMNGYGTPGMPKVVVLGGSDHTIYYNRNDVSITFNGVQTAINNALSAPLSISEDHYKNMSFSYFPNPISNGKLNFNFLNQELEEGYTFKILDHLGKVTRVFHIDSFSSQKDYTTLDVSDLKSGVYYFNISSRLYSETVKFLIIQ